MNSQAPIVPHESLFRNNRQPPSASLSDGQIDGIASITNGLRLRGHDTHCVFWEPTMLSVDKVLRIVSPPGFARDIVHLANGARRAIESIRHHART
jgi:hypothetical protein